VHDFHRGWLPRILGLAALIADGELAAAWTSGEARKAQAASFDELHGLVFEELQSEAMLRELEANLPGEDERQEAIASFLRAIAHVKLQVAAFPALRDPRWLVVSRSWEHLRGAAEALREAFRA
jgi:hypothetical protein